MDPFLTFTLCFLSFLSGWFVCHCIRSSPDRAATTGSESLTVPQVVVNVPTDYRPLEPLTIDGKPALVGPRALLWWSVYHKTITMAGAPAYDDDIESAKDAAKEAIRSVYGFTFDA